MTADKRPLKVFLCHAHADRDPVRGLYARLTQDGVDAWLDKAKLLPGQDWELEIRKAVREADVVVVCLSKQFNQAGFRQKEVRLALDTAMEKPEGEIFIIPARLEECEEFESLKRWHWVDLFEKGGYERLIRSLQVHADKIGKILSPLEDIYKDIDPKFIHSDLLSYNLSFNDKALNEMSILGLTQQSVIKLVQDEFVSHLNYFKYDLQDYPMPVKDGYIVVLEKTEDRVVFHSVKKASWGELELSSWNNILGLYRRASRYQYRTNPNYVLRSETVRLIIESHEEILFRIIRHLGVYKKLDFADDPIGFYGGLTHVVEALQNYDMKKPEKAADVVKYLEDNFDVGKDGLLFYVISIITTFEDVMSIQADFENDLISQQNADQEIVLSLERTLQYIHKIILSIML